MSVLEGDSSQFGDDGQPVWLLPACLGMGGQNLVKIRSNMPIF
jgi:hypothetical protein